MDPDQTKFQTKSICLCLLNESEMLSMALWSRDECFTVRRTCGLRKHTCMRADGFLQEGENKPLSAGSLRGACFNSSESGTRSAGGRVASSSRPVAFRLSHEVRPRGFVSGHWARRPLFAAQKRGFGVRHGAVLAAARFCDSRRPRQASALVRLPHSQHPSH